MKVQFLNHVLIVERGTLHDGASQQHGVHVRHGGHDPGATDLVGHGTEKRASTVCLVFIGNCPARRFGSHAQGLAEGEVVHLQHHAVGGNGQVAPRCVPVVYIFLHLFGTVHHLYVFRDLESPFFCQQELLVVGCHVNLVANQLIEIGVQFSAFHDC